MVYTSSVEGIVSHDFQTLDLKRTKANKAKSAMPKIPIPKENMESLDTPR